MFTSKYDRMSAVRYALRWALSRNPEFYNFTDVGGDCTSFASQCVYAGSGIMNYTPTFGWYYISADNKSPSWTGVEYFYNFMTSNNGVGPFAEERPLSDLVPGDIIQLRNTDGRYYHSLVLTMVRSFSGGRTYYVCAHSNDAYQRNLDAYTFESLRGIHFLGVRNP